MANRILGALLRPRLLSNLPSIWLLLSAVIIMTLGSLVNGDGPEGNSDHRQFLIIGVSGGLQDGFPDHDKMDYHSGQPDESKAIFLGKALVRGYKAFFDVMQPGWRQYTPEPGQPLINSNVFASGCYEHANEYWIYIVDSRHTMSILNNEPRFLSITPDTGMIDLDNSIAGTDARVRDFMLGEIKRQNKNDMLHVAVPLVTAVWFDKSHVPSPSIRVHEDGTEVTNFPESLAIWANVSDIDRTAVSNAQCGNNEPCSEERLAQAILAETRYWDGIRKAVREAERNTPSKEDFGPPFKCKRNVRFGVGHDTARVNYPFSAAGIEERLKDIGYKVEYTDGEIRPIDNTNTEL